MKYKKNIKLDYWHTFVRNLNFTQAIWMMYLYHIGFNLFEIGIYESIFHLTSLSMEVPTGMVADLYGRKTSRVIGIIFYLLYLGIILTSTNVILVGVGFVFCALGYTFESGSGEALVYDSLIKMGKEKTFIRVNGNKEIIYQVASTIGIFAGGLLAMAYLELNFYLTAVLMVIAMVVVLFMKEVPVKKERKDFGTMLVEHYITTIGSAFKQKRAFLLILIGTIIAAPVTTVFLFMGNYMDILGFDYWEIGIVVASHAFFAAIGGYFAFALEKRFKEKKILYFAPLFIVICFWLMTVESMMFYAFALMGFFDTILYVVISDYLNKIVPSEVRASVLSVFGLMFSLVMIIIFPIVGFIGQQSGLDSGFFVLAIIVSVIYVFLIIILKGNHMDETRKEDSNESNHLSQP